MLKEQILKFKKLSLILLFIFSFSLTNYTSTAFAIGVDRIIGDQTGTENDDNEGNESNQSENEETIDPFSSFKTEEVPFEPVEIELITDTSYDIKVEGGNVDNAQSQMIYFFTALIDILKMAASVMFMFGLGKLFMSFKDERPEEKVNAGMYILGAVLILSLQGILNAIILNTGR